MLTCCLLRIRISKMAFPPTKKYGSTGKMGELFRNIFLFDLQHLEEATGNHQLRKHYSNNGCQKTQLSRKLQVGTRKWDMWKMYNYKLNRIVSAEVEEVFFPTSHSGAQNYPAENCRKIRKLEPQSNNYINSKSRTKSIPCGLFPMCLDQNIYKILSHRRWSWQEAPCWRPS